MKILAIAGFIIGSLALGIGILYCLNNRSGHTGVDPRLCSLGFLPIFAAGILCLLQSNLRDQFGWLALLLGIFGMGFGFFIDFTGIMREYSRWALGGLKNPPDNAALLISGYFLIALLALIGVSRLFRTRTS